MGQAAQIHRSGGVGPRFRGDDSGVQARVTGQVAHNDFIPPTYALDRRITGTKTPAALMDIEALKRQAAARALQWVRPGMRLGLGTGSTARHFVELLGERVRAGLDVVGVPTSETTAADARRFGIRLTTLDETPQLDLTIDGADEIDADLTLI